MPGANVLLVAAAAAALYLGGMKIVHGLKKFEHKIVRLLDRGDVKKPVL